MARRPRSPRRKRACPPREAPARLRGEKGEDRTLAAGKPYFRAAFEGNPAAMVIVEPDSTISMVNDAYCRLSGYAREEVVGTSWTMQIPPGDLERMKEYNRRRLADPASAPDRYEFTFRRRDGEVLECLMSVSLIPETRAIVAAFLDITERKRMEDRLRVSEERHRTLADNARDVVWTMALDGTITYVSPSVEKVRGFTAEEAMRQGIDEIHTPASAAISMGYFTTLYADIQAGRPPQRFRGELEYRCKDGSTVWTEVMALPVVGPDGAVVEILGVTRDLADRKRAEEALRASETRFRTLAEESPVGIFQADARGHIVYLNRMGMEMLGTTQERASGQGLHGMVHPADRSRVLAEWDEAVAAGRGFASEFRCVGAHGKVLTLRGQSTALRGAGGGVEGFIGVFIDLTERRALEEQLAVASRLASLGTLVAGVAHEINNPLGGALASHEFVEEEVRRLQALLQSAAPLDREELARRLSEVTDALGDAQAGERRIAAIVKDLALFGRPDPRRTTLSLARVVEGAMRWLPPALKQGATIHQEDQGAPDVVASEGQLGQVVLNLLTNAIQSAPGGRKTNVRVRIGPGAPGRALLEVADDGAGISPEVMRHVFDPFFTTRVVGQGMGLGLALSHAIVTAHGGTITATSELGKGSTFRVELPVAAEGG
jgi:PAS domain S-box-containing protein